MNVVVDILERDIERDLRVQHQGTSQEHVGVEGGIPTLQAGRRQRLSYIYQYTAVDMDYTAHLTAIDNSI